MDLSHLEWPFFDKEHRALAASFAEWTSSQLSRYEKAEGGDGIAAREIFQRLAQDGWLNATVPNAPENDIIDLGRVCLLREIAAYSSAMADVALSEHGLVSCRSFSPHRQAYERTTSPGIFVAS